MRVVVASQNRAKVREIASILGLCGIEVVPQAELDGLPDVEETGTTYAANALLKARAIAGVTGLVTIADDSGIEVDFLGGKPGIHSARFAGPDATDEERNQRILDLLEGLPDRDRGAAFRCTAAWATPDGRAVTFAGSVRGRIAREPCGTGGFGYDPIFFYPPYGVTFGQVDAKRKHAVSHRGRAFRLLADFVSVTAHAVNGPGTGV